MGGARGALASLSSCGARGGFTLIEVLVTVGLLMLVIGLLAYPLLTTFSYFRSATARADAQSAARIALDAVARELTEAMYVQLDMYDSSMIALVPPLRVDADDPNSELVTPPRPDWDRAIRFWRALTDPERDYDPLGRYGPVNTFYLARTEVPYPNYSYDEWNRWNAEWAQGQSESLDQGVDNWAPIPRVVHTDIDWRYDSATGSWQAGVRNETTQPGFPYLWVQYRHGTGEIDSAQRAREYREYAVAMTPTDSDYDVTRLEFGPTVVAGEWLELIEGANGEEKSVYQAQYPLWRLGAKYTGWAALSGEPYLAAALDEWHWARDPFILIYRYGPVYVENPSGPWSYGLFAVGVFDPRTRTIKIMDPQSGSEVYDSGSYPRRDDTQWAGLGMDWIRGTLRCDFPPLTGDGMVDWEPLRVPGSTLEDTTAAGLPFYEAPLSRYWQNRTGGEPLTEFLVEGSLRVRIDADGDGQPERTLTEVSCTPRDYSDEFQIGLDEMATGGLDPLGPVYGWIRLPEHLATADPAVDVRASDAAYYFIDFRWRSNGIWIDDGRLDEHPDKISAYYRTAAVIDVSVGVRKAGMQVGQSEDIAQAVNMTRSVKLRNALREIRYAEE